LFLVARARRLQSCFRVDAVDRVDGAPRLRCGTGALAGHPSGDTLPRRGRRLEPVCLLNQVRSR